MMSIKNSCWMSASGLSNLRGRRLNQYPIKGEQLKD